MQVSRTPMVTFIPAHFHERLMERFGVQLSDREVQDLLKGAEEQLKLDPPTPEEESLPLECCIIRPGEPGHGVRFWAVYVPARRRIVTCIPVNGSSTGHRKFIKKIIPRLHKFHSETRAEYNARIRNKNKERMRKNQKR